MTKVKENEVIQTYEVKVGKIRRHFNKHKSKYILLGGIALGSAVSHMTKGSSGSNGLVKHLIAINSPVTNHIVNIVSTSERGDASITSKPQKKHTL